MSNDLKPRLIIVAGPTASGKSAAAVELCRMIGGEVVSADSMQIYRGMDIGTAKPSAGEMAGVRHHLIDVAQPGERWSAARYAAAAGEAVSSIYSRGAQPVICGGTGLYINALTLPMGFAGEGGGEVRAELTAIAGTEGGRERLHEMLEEIDPVSSARLHVNDVRRVVRAIEIYRLTGKTQSDHSAGDAARDSDYEVFMFALNWPREELYARINARVDGMIAGGLVAEAEALMAGYGDGISTASQAIGYKEIFAHLRGECGLGEAVDKIKQGTRNYAKRQLTWFRRDPRVRWIEAAAESAGGIAKMMVEAVYGG